jgi:O-antigen ligase
MLTEASRPTLWGALAVAVATLLAIGPLPGLALLAVACAAWLTLIRPIVMVAAYAAIICANVADVATDLSGLPPLGGLLVPALAGALMLRAASGAEDISGGLRLLPAVALYFLAHALALLWVRDAEATVIDLVDLAKNLLIVLTLAGYLTTMERIRTVVRAMAFAIAAIAALSVFQYVTGTFDSAYLGFANAAMKQIAGETESWRASGPLPDPNYFGQVLVLGLPLALAMALTERRGALRLLAAAGGVAILAAIFVTFSRGALLGVAVMVAAGVMTLRSRWLLLSGTLLAGLVALALAPGAYLDRLAPIWQAASALLDGGQFFADPALGQRVAVVTAALEMFRQNPLLGIGFGQFPVQFADFALRGGLDLGAPAEAHSMFLEKLAETGAVGFGLLVGMIVFALVTALRARRRLAEAGRGEAAVLVGAMILSFAGYLTTAVFLHGDYERFLWLGAALLLSTGAASQPSCSASAPLSASATGRAIRS